MPRFPWTDLERAVRAEWTVTRGLRDVARDPELASLPLEDDAERVRWWLYENLEAAPPPASTEELWFRLVTARWHGRPESCDLELSGGTESDDYAAPLERTTWRPPDARAGSTVLGVLAARDLHPFEPNALAYAALCVQQALRGVHEDLLLPDAADVGVTVSFDEGPGLCLGRFDGRDWDRESFYRF